MAVSGKISQNIPGMQEKADKLKTMADEFTKDTPSFGDTTYVTDGLAGVHQECKGQAYDAIKDNDKTSYKALENWCDMANALVTFLQEDIDAFLKADGQG